MIINYYDEEIIKGKKSIFLAGPVPRDKETISWRNEACQKLLEFGFDGVVYFPEYHSKKTKDNYTEQSMWERMALTEATVILFWVPRSLPKMPAFTTNVEFGYWLHTKKVIYGRPDDAEKIEYLDWLYQIDYNKKPYNNIDDLLKDAITMANELYK